MVFVDALRACVGITAGAPKLEDAPERCIGLLEIAVDRISAREPVCRHVLVEPRGEPVRPPPVLRVTPCEKLVGLVRRPRRFRAKEVHVVLEHGSKLIQVARA